MNKEECIKYMIDFVEKIEKAHNLDKLNADPKERKMIVNEIKNELEKVTNDENK